jgi:hypothetical protein
MSEQVVEKLVSLGGKRWQKTGNNGEAMDRVYFDAKILRELYGLKLSFYNTGNISSATLDGEHVSNSQAGRILGEIEGCKFWYDIITGKFNWKGLGGHVDGGDIAKAIRAKLAEA